MTKPVPALGQAFTLVSLSLWECCVSVFSAVATVASVLGLTDRLLPLAQAMMRRNAQLEREVAEQQTGIVIPAPTTTARKKEKLWHVVAPSMALRLAAAPVALFLYRLVIGGSPTLYRLVDGDSYPRYTQFCEPVPAAERLSTVDENGDPVTDDLRCESVEVPDNATVTLHSGEVVEWAHLPSQAWHDPGPGLVFFGVTTLGALVLAGPAVRLHALLARGALSEPDARALAERVRRVEASRTLALDQQADEISRIERDLHDGAQARLVSLGMTLGAAQAMVGSDPAEARRLMSAAKRDSAAALAEIRSIVRGIQPPVLADRGLVSALQTLAASSPLDVKVVSELNHRLVPALESALYFAAAELLTNATRHSGADWVGIEVVSQTGYVAVIVTDDGFGGVHLPDLNGTGGLSGLQRRLAPFDARLLIDSPPGGPTVATVLAPDRRMPRA